MCSRGSTMTANVTELWRIVESLRLELASLRTNFTLSDIDVLATAVQVDSMGTDMDSFWLMLGSMLVVFMQAGFAMLEVGSVGAKHTNDILIKNLLDVAVASMVWWSFGFAIAYGRKTESGSFNQFFGPGSFFTNGEGFVDETGYYGTAEGYNWAFWLFQMSFSGAAVTIVSGAVGTRITMTGYVLFAQIMSGFIYPVVVRWGWNNYGWASAWSDNLLFGCGAIDFAGTGVIHATGGMAALVMVTLTGPFLDRGPDKDCSGSTPDHRVTLQTLGAFILWVGWYGFNGCSTLYITGSSHVAAKAMVCTTVSAAAASLGTTAASLVLYQHVGPPEVINGLLSGLVAITGCCAVVEVEAAFFIGLVAATNYLAASRFLELVHIDDMVDASPVHLVNGVWGMVAAGLFASEEGYDVAYHADRAQRCCGWLYGCGTAQLMANVCFLVALLCWTGFTTLLVGSCLKRLGVLRISKAQERKGTDTLALKSTEMTNFGQSMLSRIEALAAKIGNNDEDTSEGTISRSVVVSPISLSSRARMQTRRVFVASRKLETPSPTDNVRLQQEVLPASGGLIAILEDKGSLGRNAASNATQASDKPPSSYATSPSGTAPSSAGSPKTVKTSSPLVRDLSEKSGADDGMEDRITPFVTSDSPSTHSPVASP